MATPTCKPNCFPTAYHIHVHTVYLLSITCTCTYQYCIRIACICLLYMYLNYVTLYLYGFQELQLTVNCTPLPFEQLNVVLSFWLLVHM